MDVGCGCRMWMLDVESLFGLGGLRIGVTSACTVCWKFSLRTGVIQNFQ